MHGRHNADSGTGLRPPAFEKAPPVAAIIPVCLPIARARADQRFRELDRDRNGQLSPDEFAVAVMIDPARLPPAPVLRFDQNRDGQVTQLEFRTGTQANFDAMDRDRDGQVTPAEMRAGGLLK